MKVAVTSTGNTLDSPVDLRLGRAKWILVVDTDTGDFEAYDNQDSAEANHGAGTQTAQQLSQLGVEAVITGNIGPNAYRAIGPTNIKVYLVTGGTVQEAVEHFKAGSLGEVEEANVRGHWA